MNRTAAEKAARDFVVGQVVWHESYKRYMKILALVYERLEDSPIHSYIVAAWNTNGTIQVFADKMRSLTKEEIGADIIERACGQDKSVTEELKAGLASVGIEMIEPTDLRNQAGQFMLNRGVKMGVPLDPGKVQTLLVDFVNSRACGQDAAPNTDWMMRLAQRIVDYPEGFAYPESVVHIIREEYGERSCGATAWVSVSEKLPEEDARVLVWNKAVKDWEIATRGRGRFIDDTGTQTDLTDVVTYWAACPSPPTGRTEEK